MKTRYLVWMAAAVGLAAYAQVSGNQSLNGKYYFRQVLLIADATANITSTTSGAGTLTFDGKGNFTISGQQLAGTIPAASLSGSGTYVVKPGGFVTLTNPLRPGPASTVNARLAQTALVGSSTEAGTTVFDMFIAIPAPSTPLSNSALTGAYWISSLELPNGGAANIRDTNFKLTANGSGSFAENTVTGQAVNLGNKLLNQTVSPMTYSVSPDGTGTLTFPASGDPTTQLIAGVKNIFMSADGTTFIGGSTAAGGHGLVIGVKTFTTAATNANWNASYFAAGMRYDTQPARLAAVTGAVHATGDGNSIWSRRTRQSDGLFDASPLITYNLTSDGSGTFSSTTGHINLAVNGKAFASSGVDITDSGSYEIYFGSLMAPQSGSGVFLNPQGVFNAASFAPAGFPVSPGGVITMFGTGFPAQSATASAPFPATLGGVQVTVNGTPAPIYSVTSQQISAVVPFGATGSNATIVVTVNGTKSNSVDVPLAATAPGIFSVPPNGISSGAVLHADFTLVSASSPATRGEVVLVYLTGLGAVNPAVPDGTPAPGKEPFPRITGQVNVYVGGQPATNIQYAGLAPTLAGLYQLNIQIPAGVASGTQNLAIQTVEGFTDMVSIAIQ